MIDSHCHLNCLEDVTPLGMDALFDAFPTHQLVGCLCIGLRHDTFEDMVSTVGVRDRVWFTVGNHPNESFDVTPKLEDWLHHAQRPDVLAIGETGLDFHYDFVSRSAQMARFEQHIEVARLTNKPLIIHCRDAYDEVHACLSAHRDIRFVMHCFTGTWEEAQPFIALGGMISFSGIVTFKRAEANRLAAKMVPIDRLLIETDSPYLAPVPHRGKTNTPLHLKHIAETVAKVRDVPLATIQSSTTENFLRFFEVG